jgi:dTDP-4-dehydrorhamnose reductase
VRVLVTGAGGMLGSALVPELVSAGDEVHPTDLVVSAQAPWGEDGPRLGRLDVRSRSDIGDWLKRTRPEFVIHLAAETDLEVCESDQDHAYRTNSLGTKHVALACQELDLPLAYVSTAGVFDGAKDTPYTEFDHANPINAYGASKFEGERLVEIFSRRFYIARAGWMIGGGAKDHKFVAKILSQLESGATKIYAVGDKLGTPTYAPDFARCFSALIRSGSYGLYHMACLGQGSRYDVAKKIVEVLGRADDVELVKVDSDFFRETYPAPRPRSEMMRNMMLDLQGMNTMRPWDVALEEYLLTAFPALRAIAKTA